MFFIFVNLLYIFENLLFIFAHLLFIFEKPCIINISALKLIDQYSACKNAEEKYFNKKKKNAGANDDTVVDYTTMISVDLQSSLNRFLLCFCFHKVDVLLANLKLFSVP